MPRQKLCKRILVLVVFYLCILFFSGCNTLRSTEVSNDSNIATPTVTISTEDITLDNDKCVTPFDDLSTLSLDGSLYLQIFDSIEETTNTNSNMVFTATENLTYSYSLGGFFSSPDFTKAAFTEVDSKDGQYYVNVYLINEGLPQLLDSSLFNNMVLIDWFDNDRLIFSPKEKEDMTIYLYSIDTNAFEKIPFTYTDLYPSKFLNWSWNGGKPPLPIYNPQFSHVIYMGYQSGLGYTIRQMNTKEILWGSQVPNPGNKPVWSHDGKQIYIIKQVDPGKNEEIFSIDLDGIVNQLTGLSNIYNKTELSGIYLSPDGNSIAFWLYTKNDEEEKYNHLAILDLPTKVVTEYCYNKGGGPIYWSPNGNQLAFEISDYLGGNIETIVLDLQKYLAVKMTNNKTPIGWLANP